MMTVAASAVQGRGESMKDRNRSSIGILDVLLVIFIVLKLIGVINWSWVWVLSPLWGSILFVLIILFGYWIFD